MLIECGQDMLMYHALGLEQFKQKQNRESNGVWAL